VSLVSSDFTSSFGQNFEAFYNDGKKAGTYTRVSSYVWTYRR
jgi:hypothetical protein